MPLFVPRENLDLLHSRWGFWKLVNRHVKTDGPFRPLKLFKHSTQSFYSKTKGGVDGATQQRAILRSATSHFAWEQKLVTQVLKTVCVNAFLAWRIFERRDLLQRVEDFKSLDSFRNALNKVQSTADFMIDASLDLLSHAKTLGAEEELMEPLEEVVGTEERRALISMAANRKRKRLKIFNSDKGVKLRLSVSGHVPTNSENHYCVLCGQNTGVQGKGWRGHRSSISCSICTVHLCVRVHTSLRKSCWSLWHSKKELSPVLRLRCREKGRG